MTQLAEVASVTGGLNLPALVTPSDVYARMLKSRSLADKVIDKFGLETRYKSPNRMETYNELWDHAKFRVTEEGLVSIKVEDRDPQMAADIANTYVEELNDLNRRIATQRVAANREFIQGRLTAVKHQLDSARAALEAFQNQYRAVDFDKQTQLAIAQATELKIALAKIDLDIKVSEQLVGRDNPNLKEQKQRRTIVQQQLSQLEKGTTDTSYFSLAVSAIPRLRGEYENLYSTVKVSESLYETLLGLLEQAKIQESENIPTISVLDRARVPEVKSRPRRSLIVGVTFGFSLLIAIGLAAIMGYLDRLGYEHPEDHARMAYVVNTFFGWIPGVRRKNAQAATSDRQRTSV